MKSITYLVTYSIGNREFTSKIFLQNLQSKKNDVLLSCTPFVASEKARQLISGHFLCPNKIQSSVPCGTLMRPQPATGGVQRGAELFSLSLSNNQLIVSF